MSGEEKTRWRSFAQRCRHRFFDAARSPGRKGNPMCGVFLVGTRCMERKCPLISQLPRGGKGSPAE
jgi:hypothetical protein